MTPESVLHDTADDLYLVSNVQGAPAQADGKGFISQLRPDGSVKALRFIDGESPGVELDAPKGMAIVNDVLYVADITHVRKFDRRTGKPLGSIHIAGSSFLNDVAVGPSGELFVSDSGLSEALNDSGTDAIYRIDRADRVTELARGTHLHHPNGLCATAEGVWVASFGSGELYLLDTNGQRVTTLKPPKGSLDGVVVLNDELWVSSWEAAAVYQRSGAGFVERFGSLAAPADIGIDAKRKRILVPQFNDDVVVILPL